MLAVLVVEVVVDGEQQPAAAYRVEQRAQGGFPGGLGQRRVLQRHEVERLRGERRPKGVPTDPLDVGCGEGADAIWLARCGWTVTAIEISDVAVRRARAAADLAGAAVEWVCADALQTAFPPRSFDLVSMQYPALPKAAGEAAVRTLLDTVRLAGCCSPSTTTSTTSTAST